MEMKYKVQTGNSCYYAVQNTFVFTTDLKGFEN